MRETPRRLVPPNTPEGSGVSTKAGERTAAGRCKQRPITIWHKQSTIQPSLLPPAAYLLLVAPEHAGPAGHPRLGENVVQVHHLGREKHRGFARTDGHRTSSHRSGRVRYDLRRNCSLLYAYYSSHQRASLTVQQLEGSGSLVELAARAGLRLKTVCM